MRGSTIWDIIYHPYQLSISFWTSNASDFRRFMASQWMDLVPTNHLFHLLSWFLWCVSRHTKPLTGFRSFGSWSWYKQFSMIEWQLLPLKINGNINNRESELVRYITITISFGTVSLQCLGSEGTQAVNQHLIYNTNNTFPSNRTWWCVSTPELFAYQLYRICSYLLWTLFTICTPILCESDRNDWCNDWCIKRALNTHIE